MSITVIQREEMDAILLESIDEALGDLFGQSAKSAFFGFFEEKFGLTRESIPIRLDKFVLSLSEIFGLLGVHVLGRTITKRFYSKLGLPYIEQPNNTLLDYVKEAKIALIRQQEQN